MQEKIEAVESALRIIRAYPQGGRTPEQKTSLETSWEVIKSLCVPSQTDTWRMPGGIDPRYVLREVEIPPGKRGNLAPFAGKTVHLFTSSIRGGGPQINYWILK